MIIALLVLILLAILFPGFMRAVFVGLIALFMLAMVRAPAHSSDGPLLGFPEYNVERNCENLYSPRNDLYNQCIAEEEAGYRALWFVWPSIPDEVRNTCTAITERILSAPRAKTPNLYSGVFDCVINQKAKYDAEHPNQPRRRFTP